MSRPLEPARSSTGRPARRGRATTSAPAVSPTRSAKNCTCTPHSYSHPQRAHVRSMTISRVRIGTDRSTAQLVAPPAVHRRRHRQVAHERAEQPDRRRAGRHHPLQLLADVGRVRRLDGGDAGDGGHRDLLGALLRNSKRSSHHSDSISEAPARYRRAIARPRPTPPPLPGAAVRGSTSGRPLMAALDLLGRRWALRVLWELRDGPLGFRALQAACDGMSSSVLRDRLRELTAAALVERGERRVLRADAARRRPRHRPRPPLPMGAALG